MFSNLLIVGNGLLVGQQLYKLNIDLRSSKRAAFASSTRSNFRIQWRTFILFCLYFNLTPLPAATHTFCLFSQFLGHSFKSVEAIKNYISGVRLLHILRGLPCPSFSNVDLKLSLKGLSRTLQHKPRQALPVTPTILCKIYDLLNFGNIRHVVLWSLCTLAFFTLLESPI